MDVRQLKFFIAVAEELNLTRAAERLKISQPPLTRHIQLLEESLGVQLFLRSPKGMELTDAGAILLKDARNIHALVSQAAERAQRADQGLLGVLDIGVHGSSMLSVVPRLLNQFSSTHPDVKVILHNAHHIQQIEALKQHRIVAAFDRYLPEDEDIDCRLVTREELFIALHESNPLAQEESISIDSLRKQQMILPGSLNSRTHESAMRLFRDNDFVPDLYQEVTDVLTAIAVVGSGHGATVIPQSACAFHVDNVVYRKLLTPQPACM